MEEQEEEEGGGGYRHFHHLMMTLMVVNIGDASRIEPRKSEFSMRAQTRDRMIEK